MVIRAFRSGNHHHNLAGIRVDMTTEEMMEEEMFAAILAKLEELGKKMDDTNRKADGVNQKIEKMER